MASFPDTIFSPASKNTGDTIQASHVTDLDNEVVAIEQGLRSGAAPLNSSNSTFAGLSVSGASTFAGSVQINSTAATSGIRVAVTSHGMGQFQPGEFTMGSGSSLSLGSTTRGFLFVEDGANVAGALFYLRGTGNAVNEMSDPETKFSTVLGGDVGSTGLINVGFETDHYTIENHAGGAVNVRLTLIGG